MQINKEPFTLSSINGCSTVKNALCYDPSSIVSAKYAQLPVLNVYIRLNSGLFI
jgi:hypothetical protein